LAIFARSGVFGVCFAPERPGGLFSFKILQESIFQVKKIILQMIVFQSVEEIARQRFER